MRVALLLLCFAFTLLPAEAADSPARIYKRWVRHLSPGRFPDGLARAKVEQRLGAKLLGEVKSDSVYQREGTGIAAYYELDQQHIAVCHYDVASMTLVGRLFVLSNTRTLGEYIAKHARK